MLYKNLHDIGQSCFSSDMAMHRRLFAHAKTLWIATWDTSWKPARLLRLSLWGTCASGLRKACSTCMHSIHSEEKKPKRVSAVCTFMLACSLMLPPVCPVICSCQKRAWCR